MISISPRMSLLNENFFLADEFQQGQKDADHFAAAFSADDKARSVSCALAAQAVFDVGGMKIDRRVVVGDFVKARACGRRLPASAC